MNHYLRLTTFLLSLFVITVSAQAQRLPLDQVAVFFTESIDIQSELALEQQLKDNDPNYIPRFAASTNVEIDIQVDGTWEDFPNGNSLWRYYINSTDDDVVSLNFHTNYDMPEGGEFRLYNPDKTSSYGPYTHRENNVDHKLWTPIVNGRYTVLEVYLPTSKKGDIVFQVEEIKLGMKQTGPIFEEDLDCMIDMACSQGDAWGDQSRSVAMYTLDGERWCTGTLLNNTSNDYAPYFITARHCGLGFWSAERARSLVFYWNYENSTCRPVGDDINKQIGDGKIKDATVGGATVVAFLQVGGGSKQKNSDSVLLKSTNRPDPKFNLFYSGWDATRTYISEGTGISHPAGYEKRIHFAKRDQNIGVFPVRDELVTTGGPRVAYDVFVFKNPISQAQGDTVGGSSGSALFNKDHRLVGTLFGGRGDDQDACAFPPQSNKEWLYQSLSFSWNGKRFNPADPEFENLEDDQRMDLHLDPAAGPGVEGDTPIWDGMEASQQFIAGKNTTGDIGSLNAPSPVITSSLPDQKHLWFEAELTLSNLEIVSRLFEANGPNSIPMYLAKGYVPSVNEYDIKIDILKTQVTTNLNLTTEQAKPGTWYVLLDSEFFTRYGITFTPTYQLTVNQPVLNHGKRVYYELPIDASITNLTTLLETPIGDFTLYGNDVDVSETQKDWSVVDGASVNFINSGDNNWNLLTTKNDTSDDYAYSFVVLAEVNDLFSGDKINATINVDDGSDYYHFEIYDDALEIDFDFSGAVAVCGKRGGLPTHANDCDWQRPPSPSSLIDSLQAGDWYFLVSGEDGTSYNLNPIVTYKLLPGKEVDHQGPQIRYQLDPYPSVGIMGIHIDLDAGGFNEFELYMKQGKNQTANENFNDLEVLPGSPQVYYSGGGFFNFTVQQVGTIPHQARTLRVTPITEILSGEERPTILEPFGWAMHRIKVPIGVVNVRNTLSHRPGQHLYGKMNGIPGILPGESDFDVGSVAPNNWKNLQQPGSGYLYYLIVNESAHNGGDAVASGVLRQTIQPIQVRTTPMVKIEYVMDISSDPDNMYSALLMREHLGLDFNVYANQGNLPDEANLPINRWFGNDLGDDVNNFSKIDNGGTLDGLWYFLVEHKTPGRHIGYQFQVTLEDRTYIELEDGVTTQAPMPSGGRQYFKMAVPMNADTVYADLDNHLSGDYDFYARFAQTPTPETFTWSVATPSSDEQGSTTESGAGIWYFVVDYWNKTTSGPNLDLTVSTAGVYNHDEIYSGTPVTETLPLQGQHFYRIEVPLGATQLHTTLTMPGGVDYDVYGKHQGNPSTSSFDFRGHNYGDEHLHTDNPQAGTWVIMVDYYSGDSGEYTLTVDMETGGTPVYFDDFEIDRGWISNASGSDNATTGHWERANPQATSKDGPKQLDVTTSGNHSLVTGALAGFVAGDHDIDNGLTSITSSIINLPSITVEDSLNLSFNYYLAHRSNSSPSDYLKVTVIGSNTTKVFEERGLSNNDNGAWNNHQVDISNFAGESITLTVEAADNGNPSLVEAAVDDILILLQDGGGTLPGVCNGLPQWNSTTQYWKGDRVNYNGGIWEVIHTNADPGWPEPNDAIMWAVWAFVQGC